MRTSANANCIKGTTRTPSHDSSESLLKWGLKPNPKHKNLVMFSRSTFFQGFILLSIGSQTKIPGKGEWSLAAVWRPRAGTSWGVWQSGVKQGSFTQSQQSVTVLLPLFPKGLQTPGIAEAVSCFGGTSEILTPCSDHGNQENQIYPLFFLQRRNPAGGE